VVRQIDAAAWTAEKARRAAERSHQDHDNLSYALLGVAAAHHDDIRQGLLDAIQAGSMEALHAFGDVRDLAPDVVASAVSRVATVMQDIVSNAQSGLSRVGGPDIADIATLLNLWHPAQANWKPLIELLADPLVIGDDKFHSVLRLAQDAGQIPDSQRAALATIAAELAQSQPPDYAALMGGPRDVAGPAALLQSALGTDPHTFARLTLTLASGDTGRRTWAAHLAGQRAQHEDVGLLAALVCDDEPDVRAAAAAALTKFVADHSGNSLAGDALLRALKDPGLTVPLTVAATLAKLTTSNLAISSAKRELAKHAFRPVRRAVQLSTE
jgi:hypothetical protein